MNAYMEKVLNEVKARNQGEPLFIQTVEEVFKSIEGLVAQHPESAFLQNVPLDV